MVTEQLNRALSPKTVQNNVRALSSLLSQAIEDGLISVNMALKPGKFLPKVSTRRQVNPFTREEVSIFLATAERHAAPTTRCSSVPSTPDCGRENFSLCSGAILISRVASYWSSETTPMAK